jgi:hypothetical protein
VVFLAGAAIWYLATGSRSLSPWWLGAAAGLFLVLIGLHERVIRARERAQRAAGYWERSLARIEDRWAGQGDDGARFSDAEHPFAADLDLFGHASLFQRLDVARTDGGKAALADWLKRPAPPATVRERQAAVADLRDRVDLRESLALLGDDPPGGLRVEGLARWAAREALPVSTPLRVGAAVLSSAALAGIWLWLVEGGGPTLLLGAVALELLFTWPLQARLRESLGAVERPGGELRSLAALFARLERERFEAPRLRQLGAELGVAGQLPSEQLQRLARLVDLAESRRNPFFAPFALLLLWDVHVSAAVEGWRARCGSAARRWAAAVGELEALCGLAARAWEHPDEPFPELVTDGPLLEAEALGHVLLPAERVVRNDLRLEARPSLLIVSGSNMSGKSTLLRSLGTSVVLAQAGGTVRARRLRLSPLTLGASIRINDSLQQGSSRFYAEITRLKQLVGLAEDAPPLLFLLDELLAGTNSHDRRVGAAALIRGLLERGALGLLTTHDLALAEIADGLGDRAANVHFEDRLEEGRVIFDYRMREGVVSRSNALELMRTVGLEV